MLMGEYNHAIDAKNRIFIPAKHREKLGPVFIITKNVDACLSVFSMDEWNKYTERLNALPRTQARDIARFIYSNAMEAQPDAHGRVLLTAKLREYAQIEKNAVIVGAGDHAEIWSEENWTHKNSEENPESLVNMMIDLGF